LYLTQTRDELLKLVITANFIEGAVSSSPMGHRPETALEGAAEQNERSSFISK
jgi:hypothetical protein